MRKGRIELLAPAGSFEAMIAAVQNGANAIYLGGNHFGARAFATNFSEDELKQAVEYCHLRDVSLYVTVNTLYKDEQFEQLIDYIQFLYRINVDALIIQDMGLYQIVKDHFPDFEIHMSTQASVHNIEGVRFFEQQNVDRVVLARENSLHEIENICQNTNIDIEVFVHGAICMSYSGQCLMSSMIAKRSGNRGECGQPCRLQYDFIKNGHIEETEQHFLLSPKDLCSIKDIGKLIDAGVKSFKIEGRMKRPEYVGTVVRKYREAIDHYLNGQSYQIDKPLLEMKKMFNRGFTGGFLLNDRYFTSKDIPGNRGIKVGKILSYDKRRHLLKIKLIDYLYQNDRIYFAKEDLTRTITKLFKNGLLVNHAEKGETIEIELDKKIDLHQSIYKVIDINLIQNMQKYNQKEHIQIPIVMEVEGIIGDHLSLYISDGIHSYRLYSTDKIEEAKKMPLSKERIAIQLGKLGNTIYHLDKIEIKFPKNGIISIKEINTLRRTAVEKLNQLRCQNKRQIHQINIDNQFSFHVPQSKKLTIQIQNVKQLSLIDNDDISQIFIPFYLFEQIENIDYNVMIPVIPYLYKEKDLIQFISSSYYKNCSKVMVSDFGAYQLIHHDKPVILNYHFNLCNSYAINSLQHDTVLSYELSLFDINHIKSGVDLYFIAYGQIINMNLKHCLISDFYLGYKKKGCHICQDHHFQLKDRKNKYFDIIHDQYCNNIKQYMIL